MALTAQLYGTNSSSCGYCGRAGRPAVALGATCKSVTCQMYLDLLDRGWRRSGTYFYCKHNDKTCCPHLTIKLDTHRFDISKQQRAVLRRIHRFLRTGSVKAEAAAGRQRGGTAARRRQVPHEGEVAAAVRAALAALPATFDAVVEHDVDAVSAVRARARVSVRP